MDISKGWSLIGDSLRVSWGIECKDPKTNSCQVEDATLREDFYSFFQYKFVKASVHARLNPDQVLETEGIEKLPLRLIEGGQPWPFGGWGVLGLSPQGDFARYVRRLAEEDFSLGMKFQLTTPRADNERLAFESFVIQNPIVDPNTVLVSVELSESEEFWTLQGDLSLPDTEYQLQNRRFCLSSTASEIVQVIDALEFNRSVQRLACGGKVWTDCTRANADLSKLQPLTLIFSGAQFTFSPQEYVFFGRHEELKTRIGDIWSMRSDQQCPPGTELGLGKLFFQKYFPLFTFTTDGKSKLSLLDKLEIKDTTTDLPRMLMIVGGVVLFAVIIFAIVRSKEQNISGYSNV